MKRAAQSQKEARRRRRQRKKARKARRRSLRRRKRIAAQRQKKMKMKAMSVKRNRRRTRRRAKRGREKSQSKGARVMMMMMMQSQSQSWQRQKKMEKAVINSSSHRAEYMAFKRWIGNKRGRFPAKLNSALQNKAWGILGVESKPTCILKSLGFLKANQHTSQRVCASCVSPLQTPGAPRQTISGPGPPRRGTENRGEVGL